MNLSDLITRNLKKNTKNYYLYVFALIFSVALYFSFVTLRFNPEMDEVSGSIKGAAAMNASSVLLIGIVVVFLLYANMIFIKRRNKEIGLLQLIGLTKGRVFAILSIENLVIYSGSLLIGIMFGFVFSKLMTMILFKIIQVKQTVELEFSFAALEETLYVFVGIYLLIMLMNYVFIKKQSILSLFQVSSKAQAVVKEMKAWEMGFGAIGLLMIGGGYYLSTNMFAEHISSMQSLLFTMLLILGLVIIGTFIFYKYSIRFILNLIRMKKQGYLSIREVLSLTSVMFRMKSNTLLLTVVTTVSALAIGLLSLSYISYYSAEAVAKASVPNEFSFRNSQSRDQFIHKLDEKKIPYKEVFREGIRINLDVSKIVDGRSVLANDGVLPTVLISNKTIDGMVLAKDEIMLTGRSDAAQRVFPIKSQGEIKVIGSQGSSVLKMVDLKRRTIMPNYYTRGAYAAVVSEETYQYIVKELKPKVDGKEERLQYYGIDITDKVKRDEGNQIFNSLGLSIPDYSQEEIKTAQRLNMGMLMFIVGFLGLIFLISSGCILYFKQMDEGEEEKASYTILRKLGYTEEDLLQGIVRKQMFNFGIPLVIGLCHSYYAIKSGWFFFGTELNIPIIIVMVLYTVLYSVFGVLSVQYYKRLIRASL
ncbi:bacitracin transport system permease protein [Paenibacillus turicensis]|uniref:Bacitracin transport system permease protein n=1 Tax=Paenibacillus turicensis TaxID=160487 RepID=A0ABS4FTG9_9BACL|nr:FtsX-like permease family protein [Paenibacillus turicensis]MBP1905872.1 bacitracin transport system permease protein [Paenibacillus turicensis]